MDPAEIDHYLHQFKGLPLEDISQLLALAEARSLHAGEVYIRQGAISQKLALIREGMIRAYQPKGDGEEITLMLRWEQQIVASVDGILYQKPSRFVYQALEDTTLMEVDYIKVQSVIDNNPRLSSARNILLMQILSQAMDRLESFILLSPEERYRKLIQEKPGIFNRVPNKYISTFLGITPVSLSRIRKRISRRH